jgi:uncharacterized protein
MWSIACPTIKPQKSQDVLTAGCFIKHNLNVFNSLQARSCTASLRIVIPGGTGQVGQVLARHFHAQGHTVTVLARHLRPAPWRIVEWNGRALGAWAQEIEGADVVINLAGRNVNCRYNPANRRQIMESRVLSTRIVGRAIAAATNPPALWMNASTATIYRHALDRPMDEVSGELGGHEAGAPDTWNFSIDVATAWEREFFTAASPGTRKIALRSAMTMSPSPGGIFATLLTLVRLGLGGRAGSGEQFVSWIHDADFLSAVDLLIARDDLEGCVNICAPNPLPYSDFMAALRQACGVPFGLPATKWMLELGAFFLRTETELILKSRRVVPRRLLDAGFQFQFPDWPSAARELTRRWRGQPHSYQPRVAESSSL